MLARKLSTAALLLYYISLATAHGDCGDSTMDMGGMNNSTNSTYIRIPYEGQYKLQSYAGFDSYSGAILAHIVLEVIAWFFVLPIGVCRLSVRHCVTTNFAPGIMFSTTRSRLALPTQFLFLILNGLGVLLGTIYNVNTPDLYENNAHHKIGWIATWVMTAQVVMGLLLLYSGQSKKASGPAHERAAFLPISVESVAQHNQLHDATGYSNIRWSGDSGQGTERSSSRTSRDISPTDPDRYTKPEAEEDDEDDDNVPRSRGLLCNTFVDKYLSQRIPGLQSHRLRKGLETVYEVIDRTILVLGFIALTTGGVTYAGIFVRRSPGAGEVDHIRKLTVTSVQRTSSVASHILSKVRFILSLGF